MSKRRGRGLRAAAVRLLSAFTMAFVVSCGTPRADPDGTMRPSIHEALDQQAAAWNRWDLDAFLATYEEDLLFASSGKLLRGRDLLERRYRENYGEEGRGVLSFSDLEITSLGPDAALTLGRYHLQKPEGAAHGQFSLVFRRGEQGWRIFHDHSSAEDP